MTDWAEPDNFDPIIVPKGELSKLWLRDLTPEEMEELGIGVISHIKLTEKLKLN